MNKENLRNYAGVLIAVLLGLGVAAAGSQGGYKLGSMPIYALGVLAAFVIQWLAFIPAYLLKTEKFYDLAGSITYLSVMFLAVALTPVRDLRSWVLLALVGVWAVRLGSFLFMRIKKAGEDRRFREIKRSFGRFLQAWTLQGLWVTFSLAAALAVITSQERVPADVFLVIGVLVWLSGFAVEVTADHQKSRFRADPENQGQFINTGLWAWSRHPNYFGEIVLWVGVMIIALPVLRGWQWVSLISPIFITILLTRISGVPLLEQRADKKWGGQADYEAYKASTPVLFPRPPKGE